jgi:uncharacterized protein
LSTLTNAGPAFGSLVPRALGTRANLDTAWDLIVSAGADTLAGNVAQRRRSGCANIFYGSLRRYDPADFNLVLTSYSANAGRPNHAMTLKPSAFDPTVLTPRTLAGNDHPTIGLLVGGDSGTVHFTARDWTDLTDLVAAPHPGRWIVSNSRRTAPAASDLLAACARSHPDRVRFIDVRKGGGGNLSDLLDASDVVAVTVDSSSMISEAIWARRPVLVLTPTAYRLPTLEQGYRDYLTGERWATQIPLAGATPQALVARLAGVAPMTGNPLDALAELIKQRIPGLFEP